MSLPEYNQWKDWRFLLTLVGGVLAYTAFLVIGSAALFLFGRWCARLLGWEQP